MFEELVKEITKELEAKESRGDPEVVMLRITLSMQFALFSAELWKASLSYPQRESHNQSSQWILF